MRGLGIRTLGLVALLTGLLAVGLTGVSWADAPPPAAAAGGLEPHRLFSDNMVLQRDAAVPVWGKAAPGQTVTVTLGDQTVSGVADEQGVWRVKLGPLAAGGPFEMVIATAAEKRAIRNVLVGEVWLCAGQSNMDWPVRLAKNPKTEIAAAAYPQIRLYQLDRRGAKTPQQWLDSGTWRECSPETVADFSALAYFFGRDLHTRMQAPVALIQSSWGGSMARSWTALEELEADPEFSAIAKTYHSTATRYEEELAQGIVDEDGWYVDPGPQPKEKGWESPDLDDSGWKTIELPQPNRWAGPLLANNGTFWFRKTIEIPESWQGQAIELSLGQISHDDITYFNGTEVGRTTRQTIAAGQGSNRRTYKVPGELVRPGTNVIAIRVFNAAWTAATILSIPDWAKPPFACARLNAKELIPLKGEWKYQVALPLKRKTIFGFTRSHHAPTCLFNNMVYPVAPYGIRGVIWYQGESDVHNAWEYRALFQAMIHSWRKAWGRDDLPFIYAQLPPIGKAAVNPGDDVNARDSWAELREAQAMALALPNTGMAVLIDSDEARTIHPLNKQWAAERFARVARAVVYGEGIEHSGPVYDAMKIEGGRIRITFKHTGGGLVAKDSENGELRRFAIAGEDRNFVWANAVIEGDTVLVWSDQVPNPVAVRYAWAGNPDGCNLFNKAGLPAPPFRTDDWPERTTGRKFPF